MEPDPPGSPEQIDSRSAFARELTHLRLAAGLTVRQLAARLDVPVATLGDYFSGRHLPGPARFPLIRRLLAECGVAEEVHVQRWIVALVHLKTDTSRRGDTDRPAD